MHANGVTMTRAPGLAVQVYNAIVGGIISGSFKPGHRLVLEHVAEQLGVSPTPVREAFARLIQEGLIQEEPPRRLRIVPLNESYVTDTFQVQAALEGLVAELAAQKITTSELGEIGDIVHQSGLALEQKRFDIYIEGDRSLHDTLLRVADNDVLRRNLQALQNHIGFIRGYCQRTSRDHLRHSQLEHQEIIEALVLKDAKQARQCMERHILNTGERVVNLLNFQPLEPV